MVSISIGELLKYVTEHTVGFLKAEADKIQTVHELVDGMRDELEMIRYFLYNRAEQEEDNGLDLEGIGKVRKLRDVMFQMEDIIDEWELLQQKQHHQLQEIDRSSLSCRDPTQDGCSTYTCKMLDKGLQSLDRIEKAPSSFKSKHKTSCAVLRIKRAIEKIVGKYDIPSSRLGRICYYESIFKRQDPNPEAEISQHVCQDLSIRPLQKADSELVGIEERKRKVIEMLDLEEKLVTEGNQNYDKHGKLEGPLLVVVWGEPGVGKTTLVDKVFEDTMIKKEFPIRIWITANKCCKIEDLLKSLLKQFLEQSEKSLIRIYPYQEQAEVEGDAIAKHVERLKDNPVLITDALRRHLSGTEKRRFILALDQVSETDELAKYIKAALLTSETNHGSRILMTTIGQRTANYWKASWPNGKAYSMETLSKDHARELFDKKVFGPNGECPWKLEEIKEKILDDCEGLPYLIEKVASQFSTTDKWIELYNKFQSNPLSGHERREFLSRYHEMPSELKPCFLYLSMFPKGYEVDRMRIVRLWIAEGFIKSRNYSSNTLEEIAEDYLDELVERGMVRAMERDETGRNKKIQFHRFWHSMVLSRLDNLSFVILPRGNNMYSCKGISRHCYRRLSVHREISDTPLPTSVRSIFSFVEVEHFPIRWKQPYQNTAFLLKVLDLAQTKLTEVPIVLGQFHNLRYLSLRGTRVSKVDGFIGKLWNLQTLDLKQSEVLSLPESIKNLTQLRHLLVCKYDYRKVRPVKIPPKTLPRFKDLQKLAFMDGSSHELVSELKQLTQLRRLGIVNLKEEHGPVLFQAIKEMVHLRGLNVRAKQGDFLDLDQAIIDDKFPKHLERLYLKGKLKNEKLPEWVLNLCHLVKLRLRCPGLKRDLLEDFSGPRELMVLELEDYEGVSLDFGYETFANLRILRLQYLRNLKEILVGGESLQCRQKTETRDNRKITYREWPRSLSDEKMTFRIEDVVSWIDDQYSNGTCIRLESVKSAPL